MPYPLDIFDCEFSAYDTGRGAWPASTPQLTTGSGDHQPGDMRVCIYIVGYGLYTPYNEDYPPPTPSWTLTAPAGWSKVADQAFHRGTWEFNWGGGEIDRDDYYTRRAVFYRPLGSSPVAPANPTHNWSAGVYFTGAWSVGMTVRNPYYSQSWPVNMTGWDVNFESPASTNAAAGGVTRPGDGVLVCIWGTHVVTGDPDPWPPPAGMTPLGYDRDVRTADNFTMQMMAARQALTGSGATGTRTATIPTSRTWTAHTLYFTVNPDVTATIGAAAETDAAATTTPTLLNSVSFEIGSALAEVDAAARVFTPLTGRRTSEPLTIPEGEVLSSAITWRETAPPGTSVLVETSVDGGLTWQTATRNEAVPRLAAGSTEVRTVLTRVTLEKANTTDPTPRVQELRVEVSVDQSYSEMCPLGVFVINDVSVVDGPSGVTVEIAGADLSRRVARNKWEGTYLIPSGTNYGTAIMGIIADRMPDAEFNFASTTRTMPRRVLGQQGNTDPWADARKLAAEIGFDLFFDARGICTFREEPDPEIQPPVWEFEDIAFPTVTQLTRQVLDEDTYNQVIVEGEGSGVTTPVRAIAQDTDPASPTYILGPYGINSITIRSPGITTLGQAQDAANAALLRSKGATEKVSITAVPQPALEPGDVVTVTRGLSRVDGQFLIDAITIPLGPRDAMSITSRRQRL